MNKVASFLIFFLISGMSIYAQVGINNNNSAPNPSAALDVNFNDKGFLPPRMTFEQRNAIQNPAEGLMVYCTNCKPDGTGTVTIFQGGKWMNLCYLNCDLPNTPLPGTQFPSETQIIWNWNSVPAATGYKWNTTNSYSTAVDLGDSLSKTETGLTCFTEYTRYVWAYNSCGNSASLSLTDTTAYIPVTVSPVEGMHIAGFSTIIWNWSIVEGATGYKWNTTNDYNTAEDTGNDNSLTETNMACGTYNSRYVWAYNACGYSISTQLTMATTSCTECGSPITDVRDNTIYSTVLIGTQCWLAQNLNIGVMESVCLDQANDGIIQKYCQEGIEENCNIYGGLYQWAEMVQYLNGATNSSSWNPVPAGNVQGICPQGWHIPTEADWCTLTRFIDLTVNCSAVGYSGTDVGINMKSTTGWYGGGNGINTSGFTALPGGYTTMSNEFIALFHSAYFWSADDNSNINAWYRTLEANSLQINRFGYNKGEARSVRCSKD